MEKESDRVMNRSSGPPLTARLHHIALGSQDPGALASFHSEALGLELSPSPFGILGRARGRRTYFVEGESKTLAFAGFAVEGIKVLRALVTRLQDADWAFETAAEDGELFAAGAISIADPDGNRLIFGIAHEDPARFDDGRIARLQHVVVASRDAARLSGFYQSVLGFTLSDNVVNEEGALTTAFLRCSEEHHSFAVFQASSDRFDHHCYEAGDWNLIRDWGDHFARKDIPVKWGPGRHGPGNNLFLFIHDLDENWIEISAELEVVEPDRPVGEWPHSERTLNSWGAAPLRT